MTRLGERLANFCKGTSKNSAFAWTGQRDLLQHLEWIEPKTRSEPIFRGALERTGNQPLVLLGLLFIFV